MAGFELVFRCSVARDLRRLPAGEVRRILARIKHLADDPRPAGSEKLSGPEQYRIRQGPYRILYEIHDRKLAIVVVTIAHRRDVHRS